MVHSVKGNRNEGEMEVSRKWQKNRGNEGKVGYVRENRENVVISAKIQTGAVQSLIPLTLSQGGAR